MSVKPPRFDNLVRHDLATCKSASNLAFNEKVKEMIRSGRNVAHFAFGESPFPVPKCLVEALKEYAHRHEYLPMAGLLSLREEISSFHYRHDSLKLAPDGFIVAPGSKELIYLIMATFNGDFLIPAPAWTTYAPQTVLAGKNYTKVECDVSKGWKVTPETLTKALKLCANSNTNKILILTNPGNPTGTCYKEEELKQLSEVCRQTSTIVLSDEIYARLTFSGEHFTIAKYYPEGTILTSGISKWASAGGWRLGYAYFPPSLSALRDAVSSGASHTYSCAPAPMQYALAKCLKENQSELETYMQNCRMILKSMANYCYRELSEAGIGGVPSEACFYYMPDFEAIRPGLNERGIKDGQGMSEAILEEADVALMSSHAFLRPKSELTTRFCFVCFDGGAILKRIGDKTLETTLSDDSIREYCKTLVAGIDRLKKWTINLQHMKNGI